MNRQSLHQTCVIIQVKKYFHGHRCAIQVPLRLRALTLSLQHGQFRHSQEIVSDRTLRTKCLDPYPRKVCLVYEQPVMKNGLE